MIVERLTFQAKYGHGDELVALMKAPGGSGPMAKGRIYTDLTGAMFTVQFEMEYADMAALAAADQAQRSDYGKSDFQQWFGKMVAVTEKGERQLLNMESVG